MSMVLSMESTMTCMVLAKSIAGMTSSSMMSAGPFSVRHRAMWLRAHPIWWSSHLCFLENRDLSFTSRPTTASTNCGYTPAPSKRRRMASRGRPGMEITYAGTLGSFGGVYRSRRHDNAHTRATATPAQTACSRFIPVPSGFIPAAPTRWPPTWFHRSPVEIGASTASQSCRQPCF